MPRQKPKDDCRDELVELMRLAKLSHADAATLLFKDHQTIKKYCQPVTAKGHRRVDESVVLLLRVRLAELGKLPKLRYLTKVSKRARRV